MEFITKSKLCDCVGTILCVSRYHDPELSLFLEKHDVGQPALYATSWILTDFAHDLPMDTLFTLWDTYLLEESPCLHVFVCVAWLIHFRQQFLCAKASGVHEVVVS